MDSNAIVSVTCPYKCREQLDPGNFGGGSTTIHIETLSVEMGPHKNPVPIAVATPFQPRHHIGGTPFSVELLWVYNENPNDGWINPSIQYPEMPEVLEALKKQYPGTIPKLLHHLRECCCACGNSNHLDLEEGRPPLSEHQLYCKEGRCQDVALLSYRLREACRGGDLGEVQDLLAKGGSPTAPDSAGGEPIHHAIREGHLQVVQLLVDKYQVSIVTKAPGGDLPVDLAHKCGHLEVAEFLKIRAKESRLHPKTTAQLAERIAENTDKQDFSALKGMNFTQQSPYGLHASWHQRTPPSGCKDKTPQAPRSCCVCGNADPASLSYCPNCKDVVYCSRKCQKKDWKGHKAVCKLK